MAVSGNDQVFPRAGVDIAEHPTPGMTIRTWLAGQALAGLCARAEVHLSPINISLSAVQLADEVLENLNQT